MAALSVAIGAKMAVYEHREPDIPGAGAADQACAALLKELRTRCPGLLPADPLPPGGVGAEVPVTPAALGPLVVAAAGQGLPGAQAGGTAPDAVLWQQGVDALLVHITTITTAVGDGWVTVTIPVTCDQIQDAAGAPSQPVTVTFVMGTADRPAALFAAAPSRPDGPAVVTERWGDALTALAWRALLDTVAGIAAAAGRDTDGSPLIPVAVAATGKGLLVQTQARHPFDRTPVGRAVS
jgi:hypothetical protein